MNQTVQLEIERVDRSTAWLTRTLLFGFVGALGACFDGFLGDINGLSFGLALGVGFGAGVSLSLFWSILYAVSTYIPNRLSLLFWLSLSIALGFYLANSLGAFERLGSEHNTLALITIIGCSCVGVGVGLISWLTEPQVRTPHHFQSLVTGRFRLASSSLLVVGGITAFVLERHILVGLYPLAHKALLVLASFSVSTGVIIWMRDRALRTLFARPAWMLCLALLGNAFAELHSDADAELEALRRQPIIAFSIDVLRSMTDFDRDDYSSLLSGGDCAPFDASRNPGVPEIAGNGIDDNCLYGDAKLSEPVDVQGAASTPPSKGDSQNVRPKTSIVLITVDTVRADHMSIYGYKRRTFPQLERYITEATVFDRAYSSSAWTSLTISSLMRGLYPRHLKWTPVYETNRFRLLRDPDSELEEKEKVRMTFTMPLDDPRPSLAQVLQAEGYYTAAIVNDGYSDFLSERMGVAAGFDRFESMDDRPRKKRNVRGTITEAMKILRERPRGQHFFLWVHVFGPHDPSSRHSVSPQYGKSVVDKYDHELHQADFQLGRLLRYLRTYERRGEVSTVITSDHGELFFSKRRYHGVKLDEGSIRVPLVISSPGWPSGRTEVLASSVDLMPTMLAMAGVEPRPASDGDDLTPYVLGHKSANQRIRVAETWHLRKDGVRKKDLVAAFDGRYKAVYDRLKNVTKVIDQWDKRKRPRNLGVTHKRASAVVDYLKRYVDTTSGPIWDSQSGR
ncbi:MAG: sulfatase-like hydrolase/transferase [Bradymonadia bacterium]